jgi:hypothetical protein
MLATLVICATECQAQGWDDFRVSVALFGENLTNPGLSMEVEVPFLASGGHTLLAKVGMGGYFHPRNHRALFAYTSAGYRYVWENGFFVQSYARLGYFHMFVGGPVYARSYGGFAPVPDYGFPGVMFGGSLGLGWTASGVPSSPMIFSNLVLFAQYPVNGMILPRFALESGGNFSTRPQ